MFFVGLSRSHSFVAICSGLLVEDDVLGSIFATGDFLRCCTRLESRRVIRWSGVAGLFGLLFSLSIWYTRSLGWAIGFHTAWNWGMTFF